MAITNYFTLLYFVSLENVMGTGVVLWYVVCGKTRLGCGNIGICITFNISYNHIVYAKGCLNLNDKDLMNISWHILTIFVARDVNSKWERSKVGEEGGGVV